MYKYVHMKVNVWYQNTIMEYKVDKETWTEIYIHIHLRYYNYNTIWYMQTNLNTMNPSVSTTQINSFKYGHMSFTTTTKIYR